MRQNPVTVAEDSGLGLSMNSYIENSNFISLNNLHDSINDLYIFSEYIMGDFHFDKISFSNFSNKTDKAEITFVESSVKVDC